MKRLLACLFVILAISPLTFDLASAYRCFRVGGSFHMVNGNRMWIPAHTVCRGWYRGYNYGHPGVWVPGHIIYVNGQKVWVRRHWQPY